MATQVYVCPVHGAFEVRSIIGQTPDATRRCPTMVAGATQCTGKVACSRPSPWRPSAPAIRFGESWGPRA